MCCYQTAGPARPGQRDTSQIGPTAVRDRPRYESTCQVSRLPRHRGCAACWRWLALGELPALMHCKRGANAQELFPGALAEWWLSMCFWISSRTYWRVTFMLNTITWRWQRAQKRWAA